ncbi:MAG: GTPase HflX [Lachnospiraceae bacterium]|nr:GTPase HflX [Lachnospiraceae bacterium]
MEQVLQEAKEKLILVGVDCGTGDAEGSLEELSELVRTAGGETVGKVIQVREAVHPGTYVGSGKIEEIRELLRETGADGIVTDDELSPAQMKNLEDTLDVKVLDRTVLILDIFAGRAVTREGKLQVELAQLRYRMTRLAGQGKAMSRLGGGIGTRGPGESKLETDRRRIRNRISSLKREVEDLSRHRDVTRQERRKNRVPVIAIVGYTNAGKSTLLNKLTDSKVLSEDKLFATLDPTTRSVELPGGETVLLTDTVGFIHKLPHHLIDAFRSTLEEAKYADVIAHVIDASDPASAMHSDVVYQTLAELGVIGKPVVTLFNKWDRIEADPEYYRDRVPSKDPKAKMTVKTSALTGQGCRDALLAIEEILKEDKVYLDRFFAFSEAGTIQLIRKYGQLLSEEYTEEGIRVRAYVPKEIAARVGKP